MPYIDEWSGIAEVCNTENLWFHVRRCLWCGPCFQNGSPFFIGIWNIADSITIVHNKWLFLNRNDCGAYNL